MSRPIGVMAIALAIPVVSVWILARALSLPATPRRHAFLIAAVVLAVLALVAAEALWALRGRAFLTFALWTIGAVVALALERVAGHAGAHVIRLFPSLVYAGLAFAVAALYLRRAI